MYTTINSMGLISCFYQQWITTPTWQKVTDRSSRPDVFCKKVFLEISQNSRENTCARVSFLTKLQDEACNFIKKRLWQCCFPAKFTKFLFLENTSGRLLLENDMFVMSLPLWFLSVEPLSKTESKSILCSLKRLLSARMS